MPFQIVRNDITRMSVDAIVNAANTELLMGGGVCGAIFTAAGARELQAECNTLSPINTGEAVITKGYKLPAKYIIHTAGPVWHGGTDGEAELLRSCYRNSLNLAKDNKIGSIAFPLISSGIYGYPKLDAIRIAIDTIAEFLNDNELDVFLVTFNKEGFAISEDLHNDIRSFIDENYVDAMERKFSRDMHLKKITTFNEEDEKPLLAMERLDAYEDGEDKLHGIVSSPRRAARSLSDLADQLEETFQERLLRLISERDLDNADVYKRANIDRKHFSKIINPKGYKTSKNTIIALAIALQLNLDETNDLLATEGFTLSNSSYFDLLIDYCIKNRIYDIFKVNEILFAEIEQTLKV